LDAHVQPERLKSWYLQVARAATRGLAHGAIKVDGLPSWSAVDWGFLRQRRLIPKTARQISKRKVSHLARQTPSIGHMTNSVVAVDMTQAFADANAKWLHVNLRGICRTTKASAPN